MNEDAHSVPEIEELLGAYALDAVDDDERRLVDAHLLECPRCRDELAGHLEVASWMAGGGARAPEGVWERIAGSLDEQVPALRLTTDELDAARRARVPSTGGGDLDRPRPPEVPEGANVVALGSRPRRTVTQALVAAVGVAAAVILVLGVVVARQESRLDEMSREVASLDLDRAAGQAMADPDADKVALSPPSGGDTAATVVITPDGTGFLMGVSLPALPEDRTYQLWGIEGDRVISLGVLGNAPSVAAFPVGEAGFTTYALTEEVQGGVPQSANDALAVGVI